MAINIFDDEVLKRNKRFISNEIKEETLIEKSAESGVTEFGILYDKEEQKALEDPKRNIEISLDSAGVRTPSVVPSDPRTRDIILEGFERLESGKWRKLSSPNEASINKDFTNLENREELENSSEIFLRNEGRDISFLKLEDSEGNLIDPDDAIEEEEYTPVLIARREARELGITAENKDFTFLRDYVVNPENTLFPEIGNQNDFKIVQEIEEGDGTFTYNQMYENDFWEANNWFGEGRAARPGKPIRERTVNISDLEIREKTDNAFMGLTTDRLRELSIFLFMLFPYIGTSTVLNIRNAVASPDIVGLAVSSSQNAYFLMQNMRYFTPFELAKYFLHNFYTMHFMKEMTIKYAPGRVPTGAPNARQWDGRPDIFHGRENSALFYLKQLHNLGSLFRRPAEDLGDGSAALTQYKDGGENAGDGPNVLPFGSSEPLSPKIRLWGTWNSSKRKTSPTDIFGDSNPMEETKDVFVVSIPNIRVVGNKWHIDSFGENSREDLEGYEEYYNIAFRNISGENENIINTDVLNTKGYYPQFGDDGKWNEIPENGIPEDQTKNYNNYEIAEKKNFIEAKGFDLNDDVLNINLDTFKYLDNPPEGAGEPKATGETVRDAIKRRSTERDDINSLQIGSILVAPVVSEGFAESLPRFHIPFEFNPEINEGGLAANYEATSVLSRIGELQSYQGTGTFTITLETEYIATAHPEDNEVSTDGNNWMNFYTLEKIQAIEKAYRSLVLPHFPDETNIEQGYFYVKPPLLRVIMGGANDEPADTGPYANLLTYGRNEMVTGRLESAGSFFNSNSRLKNFIATEVTIIKDLKETPIVLDKKGRIKDTMGFKVSLSLTEVTANYMDSIPDFKRYSDVYKNTMNNFVVNG